MTEQILALASMKGTTTGADIFMELVRAITKFKLSWGKPPSITTDSAPAMIGAQYGVVGILRKLFTDNNSSTSICRVSLHNNQEALCSKVTNLSDVMEVVVKTVNKIRSRGLKDRPFQEFLKETKSKYCDIVYPCDVRCLSHVAVLKRFFDLRVEINTFLTGKGKPVPQLEDPAWMCDLAFLGDLMDHLNQLNLHLQGNGHLISTMVSHVKAFEMKPRLRITQME